MFEVATSSKIAISQCLLVLEESFGILYSCSFTSVYTKYIECAPVLHQEEEAIVEVLGVLRVATSSTKIVAPLRVQEGDFVAVLRVATSRKRLYLSTRGRICCSTLSTPSCYFEYEDCCTSRAELQYNEYSSSK